MRKIGVLIWFLCCGISGNGQQKLADSLLYTRGEVRFYFIANKKLLLNEVTRELSIDKVVGDTVFCYANRDQFTKFLQKGTSFCVIEPETGIKLKRAKVSEAKWNVYPSYDEYIAYMNTVANTYPDLCKLVEFGESADGRKLLAVKISDNVNQDEPEPSFFYTSSMHGDELTGYVLMLRLIEFLLLNYNTNDEITNLVNNVQIWINPLANPDGTYFLNNDNVFSAKRFNSNNVDLNRNFPDRILGSHPDGNLWQPEVVTMMNFMREHQFTMAANFHGGAEVVNYPWDHTFNLHADDDWYRFIAREYADNAQRNSYAGYMDPPWSDNGITNGAEWYVVYGSRQDYANYFMHCREVTIELSLEKTVPEDSLDNMWQYNRDAMLQYMEQCLYGIRGTVTDKNTGKPIKARVEIMDHDKDNSFVFSHETKGVFFRPVKQGNYNLRFSADGYKTEIIENLFVTDAEFIDLNVMMETSTFVDDQSDDTAVVLYPNPAQTFLYIKSKTFNQPVSVRFYTTTGQRVLEKTISSLSQKIDVSYLQSGLYVCSITTKENTVTRNIIMIAR